MQHELKQVEVRLKLTDKAGVFSMERIDTPEKAVSVLAPVLAELDREEVCVVNLDGKGRPINFNVVSIGSVNTSLTGLNRTQRLTHFLLDLDFGRGVVRKYVCWQQKDILTGHPLM